MSGSAAPCHDFQVEAAWTPSPATAPSRQWPPVRSAPPPSAWPAWPTPPRRHRPAPATPTAPTPMPSQHPAPSPAGTTTTAPPASPTCRTADPPNSPGPPEHPRGGPGARSWLHERLDEGDQIILGWRLVIDLGLGVVVEGHEHRARVICAREFGLTEFLAGGRLTDRHGVVGRT